MKSKEKFEKLCDNYIKNQSRAAALRSIFNSCGERAANIGLEYGKWPTTNPVSNRVTEHTVENEIYKIRMYLSQAEDFIKNIEDTFICGKEDALNEEDS